jgi:hypothetical protein
MNHFLFVFGSSFSAFLGLQVLWLLVVEVDRDANDIRVDFR